MTPGDRSAWALGAMFTGAGVMHFARPDFFEAIVPRWIPDARAANRISGAAEIACGLAMVPRRTRRPAAMGLLVLLVAVFPANVDMYLNDVDVERDETGKGVRREGADGVRRRNLIRLPFQFVFAGLVARHLRRQTAVTTDRCGAAGPGSSPPVPLARG